MASIQTSREIQAPAEKVFETVADIRNFSKAIPEIEKVEFLSEQQEGVGTRFRETRRMKGREAATELEVTEYEPHERVRIVSDTMGTIWDTVFRVVETAEGRCRLEMEMEARPQKLVARLTTPLAMGMVRKALEDDMDAVAAYCEGGGASDGSGGDGSEAEGEGEGAGSW